MTKKKLLAKEYAERNYIHHDDWPNNSASMIQAQKDSLARIFEDGFDAAIKQLKSLEAMEYQLDFLDTNNYEAEAEDWAYWLSMKVKVKE